MYRTRLTPTLDLYNLLNSNDVTNFSLRTGNAEHAIAALDALAAKRGARYEF